MLISVDCKDPCHKITYLVIDLSCWPNNASYIYAFLKPLWACTISNLNLFVLSILLSPIWSAFVLLSMMFFFFLHLFKDHVLCVSLKLLTANTSIANSQSLYQSEYNENLQFTPYNNVNVLLLSTSVRILP
jgi:hypothetical protein